MHRGGWAAVGVDGVDGEAWTEWTGRGGQTGRSTFECQGGSVRVNASELDIQVPRERRVEILILFRLTLPFL